MRVGGCVLLVVVTGCYRPSTAAGACHARCDPAIGDCPNQLTCGSDGVCRDPNSPTCPSEDGPDGGASGGGPNIMFVTSIAFQVGMLGGVDAADAKCREAALGNFEGHFVAYLAAKGVPAT